MPAADDIEWAAHAVGLAIHHGLRRWTTRFVRARAETSGVRVLAEWSRPATAPWTFVRVGLS